MASSITWAFLLFLAQLLASSSAHHAHADNITRLPVHFLCHPGQAKVLLDLKKSSFGKSTTSLPSWRNGTDCCLWEGVGCNSSGNVTTLDLRNRNLSGSIPGSISNLTQLISLDLSNNAINGDVPNWVWETWSSRLLVLNLSHNMLTGMELTSDVLPFITKLKALDLSFNRLWGRVPMPNSSAEILDYSNNRFSSVGPNWAFYLSSTEFLSMSKNSINGHIPISICNSRLIFLDLSINNFNGLIPSCILGPFLESLNLRENRFEGALPSNITTECALQTLELQGNKIGGQLPRGLSNCALLEVLDVGSNEIADTFPSWLGRGGGVGMLSVIILRSNQFYGSISHIVGDTEFEKCFPLLPRLQILDLASNNFSGNLRPQCFLLSSMMAQFNSTEKNLIYDDLPFGEPNGFYQDSIEITYKGQDISFERVLSALTTIDISNNRFDGNIPETLGRLVSLRGLNMSHNAFTGEIPAQLGGMTYLESLDLSSNQLSGEIPQELTDLTYLCNLNLSNNLLVGNIPQGDQFSTFDSNSFEGNAGLCGPPLSQFHCAALVKEPSHHVDVVLFLFVGLGFGVGFAASIVAK